MEKSRSTNEESFRVTFKEDDIQKAAADPRNYRCFKLENELKVMLVNDKYVERSVSVLSVHVGTMSDPKHLPGLAHFCEHMAFLGNTKYPQENGFRQFLSQNNGVTNAFTSGWNTCYHFSVAADKLIEALDRFAQFFISPLFEESAIEREVHAVHSEYEKNLTIDSRLKREVLHSLAKDHPLSSFGCGNVNTLWNIPKAKNMNVRDELIKFHRKWYSANLMSLVVISRFGLDYLQSFIEDIFSSIPNRNVEIPSWPPEPFAANYYETKLKIVPVKDIRVLTLHFITKDLNMYFKSAPEAYLAHLIGHESKGSILSELKSLGWSNTLMVDHENIFQGFGFFEITVDLTQEGLSHVDDIVLLIFQYLQLLKMQGPQKWIFDECCYINKIRFRFREKEPALSLIHYLQYATILYPFKEVLSAHYFRNEWRPDHIMMLLNDLKTEKCIISITSQRFQNDAKSIEPYYKVKYNLEKIAPKALKAWKNCKLNAKLALPSPNLFLPTHLNLYPFPQGGNRVPIIIIDDPLMRLWHCHEAELRKPKCGFNFLISKAIFDPLNTVLNQIMVALFKDDLVEVSYDATIAGLNFKVRTKMNGLAFTIEGYSDKQDLLLRIILDRIFNFKVDQKRFNILKENLIREFKNKDTEMPAELAFYYSFLILSEHGWSHEDKLKVIQSVTLDRLQKFVNEYFKSVYVEALLFGNITFQQAFEIGMDIHQRLMKANDTNSAPLSREQLYCREHRLDMGERFLFVKKTVHHLSSAIYMYYQCARQSDQVNIIAELFEEIIREPCFSILRTEEQLGYIVHSGMRKSNGSVGFHIIVQSSHHPSYVEERIHNFINTFEQILKSMDGETFMSFKKSLLRRKSERYGNFFEKNKGFWQEILLGEYHFERSFAEANFLEKYQKKDIINFFDVFISNVAKGRKNLTVYVVSSTQNQESKQSELLSITSQYTKIKDLDFLKIRDTYYPIPGPHFNYNRS